VMDPDDHPHRNGLPSSRRRNENNAYTETTRYMGDAE
jgi:hypothetical protein